VLGLIKRGGDVMTHVVPNKRRRTLEPLIFRNVIHGSRTSTDEMATYDRLGRLGYRHESVNHRSGEYVRGKVHTNTIDNFWSLLKRSIRGTHVHVSAKHLSKYLGEFEFRYNMRSSPETMLPRLLASF